MWKIFTCTCQASVSSSLEARASSGSIMSGILPTLSNESSYCFFILLTPRGFDAFLQRSSKLVSTSRAAGPSIRECKSCHGSLGQPTVDPYSVRTESKERSEGEYNRLFIVIYHWLLFSKTKYIKWLFDKEIDLYGYKPSQEWNWQISLLAFWVNNVQKWCYHLLGNISNYFMIDMGIQDLVPSKLQWNETCPKKHSYEKRVKGPFILVTVFKNHKD